MRVVDRRLAELLKFIYIVIDHDEKNLLKIMSNHGRIFINFSEKQLLLTATSLTSQFAYIIGQLNITLQIYSAFSLFNLWSPDLAWVERVFNLSTTSRAWLLRA